MSRIFSGDVDKDGRISWKEAPLLMLRRFDQVDVNGDGYLEREEIRVLGHRLGNRFKVQP